MDYDNVNPYHRTAVDYRIKNAIIILKQHTRV